MGHQRQQSQSPFLFADQSRQKTTGARDQPMAASGGGHWSHTRPARGRRLNVCFGENAGTEILRKKLTLISRWKLIVFARRGCTGKKRKQQPDANLAMLPGP